MNEILASVEQRYSHFNFALPIKANASLKLVYFFTTKRLQKILQSFHQKKYLNIGYLTSYVSRKF
jgi:hypothetical protein